MPGAPAGKTFGFIVPWLLDPAGALRLDARLILAMFAATLAIAAAAVAMLGQETRGRSLEQIAGDSGEDVKARRGAGAGERGSSWAGD